MVHELKTHADLEQLLEQDAPVLIDFYADWCGPCRVTGPRFAAAAETFEGRANFAKIDTQRARALADAFGVRSLPTLAVMQGGEVVDVHIGAAGQKQIEALAERALQRADKAAAIEAAGGGLTGRLKVLLGGRAA